MLTDVNATRSRRRAVLRGVALGAMTLCATALDWSGLFAGRAARAETSPGGLWGWDRNDCTDAFPSGYDAGFERDQFGAKAISRAGENGVSDVGESCSTRPFGRPAHGRRYTRCSTASSAR
jgi:hypothetical protein